MFQPIDTYDECNCTTKSISVLLQNVLTSNEKISPSILLGWKSPVNEFQYKLSPTARMILINLKMCN